MRIVYTDHASKSSAFQTNALNSNARRSTREKEWRGVSRWGKLEAMSVAEIKSMSIEEKLQVMEVIWEDLKSRFDGLDVAPEIKALLDDRRDRVQRGEARLLEWDDVKGTIGRA